MALASAPRWTFALAPRGSNAWRSNRAAERVRNFSTGACARTGCASVGGSLGNSHSGLVWGFSGLSSLFFPQVRSLTSSRMAKSKASKRSLRSKDLEILKCHRCFEGHSFSMHSSICGFGIGCLPSVSMFQMLLESIRPYHILATVKSFRSCCFFQMRGAMTLTS